MNPRLSRPLLTAVVSGAMVAGGAVYTSPATAATTPLSALAVEESPSAEPSVPTSEPPTEPSVPTSEPTVDPSVPAGEPTSAQPSVPASEPTSVAPSVPTSTAPTSPTPRPSVTTTTPAPRDTTKPTARFALNAGAFWTGQRVVLTQGPNDFGDTGPGDTDATLKRKISWGDGSTTNLAPTATGYAKQYTRAGKFKVTVTVTDRAGNAFTTPARLVTITVPGKASLSKKTVYQGAPFAVKVSSVPKGTTRIGVNWGDGYVTGHAGKNASITSFILYRKGDTSGRKLAGNFPVKIAFYNKLGASSYRTVGTVKVLKDSWKPVLKVTKPAKANKVSSWKTVRGTVSDKGSGLWTTRVTVARYTTSGKAYCLTPAKKWKRFTTDAQYIQYCAATGVKVKVSKGKWSLKLPSGLGKGQILVDSWAFDNADNYGYHYRIAKLTKS